MLTVTRSRLVDTGEFDRYGKPIYSTQETTHVAHGFAPVVTNDVLGVDQVIASDGGTLYFRHPNEADSLPDDEWIVSGDTYKSEGREAPWVHPSGESKGTVVVVKRAVFTND